MAPSVGESNLFSSCRTNAVIGCLIIWLGPPVLSATGSVKPNDHFLHRHQYQPFLPLATDSNENFLLAKQYDQLQSFVSSFSILVSLVDSGEISSFICSKILQQCCACHHLLFEYASVLINSPGEGLTTFHFHCKEVPWWKWSCVKDTLKACNDFKHKQQKCMM